MIEPLEYLNSHEPPKNLPEITQRVQHFVQIHKSSNRRVVLVTSGGTTVPLENQTVRFIDNFSAGTRGATSVEYFIKAGYAVVFLHRQFSLQPYTRHYTHSALSVLDLLYENDGRVEVKPEHSANLLDTLQVHSIIKKERTLLNIEFTTITEYLFSLRTCVQVLSQLGASVMYYLAAAVSDFFIPKEKMMEHKIQSGNGSLNLSMDQVPKFLKPLVAEWANNGFIVSFKLETDPSLLHAKSLQSLNRYGHQIVIGNILSTRKRIVNFITTHRNDVISLNDEEVKAGVEIEGKIIPELVKRHDVWMNCKNNHP